MISVKILTKRERIILFLTFGVIVSSLIFNFIFIPLKNRFSSLNQQILSNRVKLEKSLKLLGERERIKTRYTEISSLIKKDISEEEILADTLSELENFANISEFRIIDVRPQSPKITTGYKEFLIEIRGEARIEGALRFIYELENSTYLLKIKRFQLNPKAEGNIEGNLLISKISLF